jgi:hypothetical protein
MQNIRKLHWIAAVLFIAALVYTRFVGLGWGLPFPMHPDEWNIARSVQQLECQVSGIPLSIQALQNCFNPHFFAYGQPTIYLAAVLVGISRIFSGAQGSVQLVEAILALRTISAVSSIVCVYFMILIYWQCVVHTQRRVWHLSPMIFSPALIQFAHFGTTESVLMMLYVALTYLTMKQVRRTDGAGSLFTYSYMGMCGALIGAAVAVKLSSVVFALAPALVVIRHGYMMLRMTRAPRVKTVLDMARSLGALTVAAFVTFALLSPHFLISWADTIMSLRYESDVAMGAFLMFYTRSFALSRPVVYPLVAILPAALGWAQYIALGVALAYIFIVHRRMNRSFAMLVLFAIVYFLISSFVYTKWTRFLAPIFPLLVTALCILVAHVQEHLTSRLTIPTIIQRLMWSTLTVALCISAVAYLHVYQTPDVRFQASRWVAENIPSGSVVLSETANVVDVPIYDAAYAGARPELENISFDFYNLDQDPQLQAQLEGALARADYIVVPSRRIYANHWCNKDTIAAHTRFAKVVGETVAYEPGRCAYLRSTYPRLNEYYDQLFSGKLGFEHVKTIHSFPQITIFGRRLYVFADEQYDETWTVFDHPVIRIFKRIPSN